MRTYAERTELRRNLMDVIFSRTLKVENFVRDNWHHNNYFPSNEEVKYACDQICTIVINEAKAAFEGQRDLYRRFTKECEEIKNRFMKLNATRAIDAYCGVYQVNTYLNEEAFDLISEALGIYVPENQY